MALHFLPFFEHHQAFLSVVTTNAGTVCCFQTFLSNLGRVLPESGVPKSDILISLVVFTLAQFGTRSQKTEGPRAYAHYMGSSARAEWPTFLPS